MKEYYIISTKWTNKKDNLFTFWKANGNGYTQIIERAGLYDKDITELSEGLISVEKSIIDTYKTTLSGIENEFDMKEFSIFKNIGSIRKILGITTFNMNNKSYKSKYFGLDFKEDIYEITKKIKYKDIYIIKAKENIEEYWYYEKEVNEKSRNLAISNIFKSKEWGYITDDFFKFKNSVTCKQKEEIVFEKWSDEK